MCPMRLPSLPGRFNQPTPKRLVWFVLAPLALVCACGVLGAVVGPPTPAPTRSPEPVATVAPSSTEPAAVTTVPVTGRPTTTRPAPKPTRTKPKPPPRPPANDPRFRTCAEAKAAGYGPYRRGVDPEYSWYVDRDSDGIVCE